MVWRRPLISLLAACGLTLLAGITTAASADDDAGATPASEAAPAPAVQVLDPALVKLHDEGIAAADIGAANPASTVVGAASVSHGSWAAFSMTGDADGVVLFQSTPSGLVQRQRLEWALPGAESLLGHNMAMNDRWLAVTDGNGQQVRIYELIAGTWTYDSTLSSGDSFYGMSAAFVGDRLVVGRYVNATGGYIEVFDHNGTTWISGGTLAPAGVRGFAWSMSAAGDELLVSAAVDFVVHRVEVDGVPSITGTITAPTGLETYFGGHVKASEGTLVITNSGGELQFPGGAAIYQRKGADWDLEHVAFGDPFGKGFGRLSDIDDDLIAIGSYGNHDVRFFVWDGSTWLDAGSQPGAIGDTKGGFSVELAGSHVITPSHDAGVAEASLQVYEQAAPTVTGYWLLGAGGVVHSMGSAGNVVTPDHDADYLAADIEPLPTSGGYWTVDSSGQVRAVGVAADHGSVNQSTLQPGEAVVAITSASNGGGYWITTNQGRVFAFGSAAHHGDASGLTLAAPIVGFVSTASGDGYHLAAADGGVFAFGDASYEGSMAGLWLSGAIVGIVADSDGVGYWLIGADGGVFAFDAAYRGSVPALPFGGVNGVVTSAIGFGDGYLLVASDGGVFNFSNRPFYGSLGGSALGYDIVAIAGSAG